MSLFADDIRLFVIKYDLESSSSHTTYRHEVGIGILHNSHILDLNVRVQIDSTYSVDVDRLASCTGELDGSDLALVHDSSAVVPCMARASRIEQYTLRRAIIRRESVESECNLIWLLGRDD